MKVIGIKRLFYFDPLTAKVEKAEMLAKLKAAKEIKNTHGDTFTYEQGDPDVEEGKNGLTGKTYYRIKKNEGAKTISFTSGEFDLEDKVALQGGKANDGIWEAPTTLDFINKGIAAYTQTNDLVVFTNASIIGKTSKQDSVLGLGVQATAMDSGVKDVSDEYWYEGAKLPENLTKWLKGESEE